MAEMRRTFDEDIKIDAVRIAPCDA